MYHFVPEPRNFSEVTRLPTEVKNDWSKETLKGINNLINNQTFIMDYPSKEEPVTPFIDVYNPKKKYDGSIDK